MNRTTRLNKYKEMNNMNKIGMIVGIFMCLLIVSTSAVSASAPMDEDVKPTDRPCTALEESDSSKSDCGYEDDVSYQEPSYYDIYIIK
jgi:hypothetical protein